MNYKVEICGVDTSKLKALSTCEAEFLMKKLKEGDKESRQKFIDGNLKLVLSLSRRFIGKTENLDDIFQIGIIGLIKAIDNFDIKFNVKFSTYAVPMIVGEIKRYLRDNTCFRVSRSVKDVAYLIIQAKEKLIAKKDHEPNAEEIAKELKLSYKTVVNALESTQEPLSLFSQAFGDGEATFLDKCADEKSDGEKLIENFQILSALKTLDQKERQVIELRYYQGKTQIEVSQELNISQAQVSRLEKNALKLIANYV